MLAEPLPAAEAALTHRFLLDFPFEAARLFEAMPAADAAAALARQPPHAALRAWQALAPDVARDVLEQLPEPLARHLLAEAEPVVSVAVLTQFDASGARGLAAAPRRRRRERTARPARLPRRLRRPHDGSARQPAAHRHDGGRGDRAAAPDPPPRHARALRRRRRRAGWPAASRCRTWRWRRASCRSPTSPAAWSPSSATSTRARKSSRRCRSSRSPRCRWSTSTAASSASSARPSWSRRSRRRSSIDIQTMVGASPDERALSSPGFAVRKRLPWLQINLLTAFLAASVVGPVRRHDLAVHRAGGAAAGGRGAVGQRRRAGAGGDDARPGAARDQPAALAARCWPRKR